MSRHSDFSVLTPATDCARKLLITVGAGVIVSGCAVGYMGRASNSIDNGDWDEAYGQMEYAFGSSNASHKREALDLMKVHPELKIAARHSFSIQETERLFSKFDPPYANKVQTERINWYSVHATQAEVLEARNNLEFVFKIRNPSYQALELARQSNGRTLIVSEKVFSQLTTGDQQHFRNLYPSMNVIPYDSFGKVISAQVIDRSTPGTGGGAQVGSVVGQAAYIDYAISRRSYSAVNQVGAGIFGALLGSTVDSGPVMHYVINYGIQLTDGAVKSVVASSSDGITAPVGQCVFLSDAKEAPPYLCGDTFYSFISRTKRMSSSAGDSPPTTSEMVKCKVHNVSTLTVSAEDCKHLNGEVLN